MMKFTKGILRLEAADGAALAERLSAITSRGRGDVSTALALTAEETRLPTRVQRRFGTPEELALANGS